MPAYRRLAFVALAVGASSMMAAAPASAAGLASDVRAAASAATSQGYRTGVAVLDLRTGQYTGAGEDTAPFASESVVKVMIATQLLATGQMTGTTEQTAYRMITQSDDDAANALYGLAGGDDVINLVATRYGIADLGSPPSRAGWWGNTEITAKGLVQLYAAIGGDPVVGPWLMEAMAHAAQYGSDGTYQYFGIPSATSEAAIKQGWGDDGNDSPNAQFNSTGYVDGNQVAVAILTDGDPSTYGSAISSVVTAQARALMPGGHIAASVVATTPAPVPSSAEAAGPEPSSAAPTPAGTPDSTPAASATHLQVGVVVAAIAASVLAVVGGLLYRHWGQRRTRLAVSSENRQSLSEGVGRLVT